MLVLLNYKDYPFIEKFEDTPQGMARALKVVHPEVKGFNTQDIYSHLESLKKGEEYHTGWYTLYHSKVN